ncbi:MAG: hypothetical protein NTZ37_02125 [Methanoregula sp.]|nr:hypothetical protein [Methanoregula sp.]
MAERIRWRVAGAVPLVACATFRGPAQSTRIRNGIHTRYEAVG